MITPFCYDYQYKTESLYDSQFLGGTRYRGQQALVCIVSQPLDGYLCTKVKGVLHLVLSTASCGNFAETKDLAIFILD